MTEKKRPPLMEKIVALCKRRGFIFQSSEIYGGINGFWDYGPAGAELKKNIRDLWWEDMVRRRDDIVGIDTSVIMHPKVWEASGHVAGFQDPMVDCKKCKGRWRADQLPDSRCPEGGEHEYTEARQFNLMLRTNVGALESPDSVAYLRPETAQGMFVQFLNVVNTTRVKLPFGIAQIGKAFRNEINPRNFTFRSREFELMEVEYFISDEDDWQKWYRYWIDWCRQWLLSVGLPASHLSEHIHPKEELSHYSKGTTDIMFEFPFGVQELWGIAARGCFDLSQHTKFSGMAMEYFDDEKKRKFVPHVVEPAVGVDRIALAILCSAYQEEEVAPGDTRVVMRFAPRIAPVKVAVFPLLRNKPPLVEKAREVFKLLQPHFTTQWDDRGNVGKRYRYQDELGTPWCVTIDFETLGEKGPELADTVTLRDRDTMKQDRVKIGELVALISEKLRA
jgi:glycyl-tRNA synthetase